MDKIFNLKIKKKIIGDFEIDPNHIQERACLFKKGIQNFDLFYHIVCYDSIDRLRKDDEVVTIDIKVIKVISGYIKDGKWIVEGSPIIFKGDDVSLAYKGYIHLLERNLKAGFVRDYEQERTKTHYVRLTPKGLSEYDYTDGIIKPFTPILDKTANTTTIEPKSPLAKLLNIIKSSKIKI
jgi:hypothetical protein